MSTEKVYTADASWARKGNRSSVKYHWPRPDDAGLARCSTLTVLDVSGIGPEWVKRTMRCQRPGCKQRWAEYAARSCWWGAGRWVNRRWPILVPLEHPQDGGRRAHERHRQGCRRTPLDLPPNSVTGTGKPRMAARISLGRGGSMMVDDTGVEPVPRGVHSPREGPTVARWAFGPGVGTCQSCSPGPKVSALRKRCFHGGDLGDADEQRFDLARIQLLQIVGRDVQIEGEPDHRSGRMLAAALEEEDPR